MTRRKNWNNADDMRAVDIQAFCLLLEYFLFSVGAYGQGTTSRWAAYGKEMWNGHREQAIIALNQKGSAITGTFESLTGKTSMQLESLCRRRE